MSDKIEYLITGGTGSLGKQLVRRLIADPRHVRGIRIYSRDELKQHDMQIEFADSPIPIAYIVGDIRDYRRLTEVLKRVDRVFHTAALKHVPVAESNPLEFIQTNVYGTENVMRACIHCDVGKAVFLSTDKSVEPINLYGASKMCAEKLWLRGSVYSGGHGTKFSVVRYGNVIGSRGSILDMIKLLHSNEKIPITDLRMTRFWIPLSKVANFILNVANNMTSGNVYIPKMVACSLKTFMEAATNSTRKDWRIIGLRPGEKMHEMLINQEESKRTISYKNGYVIYPQGSLSEEQTGLTQTLFSDKRNPDFTDSILKIKEILNG